MLGTVHYIFHQHVYQSHVCGCYGYLAGTCMCVTCLLAISNCRAALVAQNFVWAYLHDSAWELMGVQNMLQVAG